MEAIISGLYWDIECASKDNCAKLIQYGWHGAGNQQFIFTHVGNGKYKIQPRHSGGKVLDVAGGSMGQCAKIIQFDWHGGDNQLFHLKPA